MATSTSPFELIFNEQYDLMKSLFRRRQFDINVIDENGNTILHYLSERENPELVRWALEFGSNINTKNNDGITPLIYASSNGDYNTVELLLKHGALPNIQNDNGNTALHVNCYEAGRPEITKILLEYGADPTIQNYLGETPLDIAIENDYREIEEILAYDLDVKGALDD